MGTVAALSVRVSANITDFEKQFASLEKQLGRAGSQLSSVGSKLTQGISIPLAAFGLAAAKAAIDFESSFAGVRKTVNASEAEFATLAQGFRDLAKAMPVSVDELNRIGEAAGQLGISKEHILDFTKVMAQLGATTNLTSDEAATSIAQIQNIFNASGQETSNFASALVALGNAGASTERGIVEMAARLAGAGNQIGMTQAEVLGLASALANLGINAEAGGTALSKVLSKMSVGVDTGGAGGFAKVAGLDSASFGALFKSDASEALTRFVEGLQRVKEAGGNLTKTLSDLGLKDVRVMDAMKRMAGAGDQLRTSLDLAKDSWMKNTALTEEYQKRAATTAAQLQILWNRLKDVAITLGTAMLPSLTLVVGAMDPLLQLSGGLADRFADLPLPIQATALGLGAVAVAAGPVIWAAGTLIKSWGALAGALGIAGKVAPLAWAAMTNPFVLFVAGVGAAIVAVDKLVSAWQRAVETVQTRGWGRGGLLSMLGENVNNADWSLFQGPGRKRGGAAPGGALPTSAPGFLAGGAAAAAAAQELEDMQRGLGRVETATDDVSKAAKRAADEWQKFLDTASGKDQIEEAQKWMRAVDQVGLTTIEAAGHQGRMNTVLEKALLVYAALGQTAPAAMAQVWAATIPRPEVLKGLTNLFDAKNKLLLGTSVEGPIPPLSAMFPSPGVTGGLPGGIPGTVIPIGTIDHLFVNPFREAFGNLGKQLPDLIFGTLMAGGSVIGALASGLGSEFARLFQERLAASTKAGTALGGATTGLGLAGMGLSAGLGGFAMGQKFGKTKGALAGAASGALAGAAFGSVVPVIGTALGAGIGAIAGGIGGWFGGRSKDKKDRKAMEEERQKLLDQFGGMEKLKNVAKDLGVNIDLAFTTKKPLEFQAAVELLNTALEKQNATIKATGEIIEGVNARAANITSQGDLNVVGAGAVAAFALQIQAGKSAIVAFQALTPAITAMKDAMAGGNFTLTESAQRLMDLGGVLEANSIQFTNLGASGQILQAMLQGNIRDGQLFAAVATDIGTQIQTVIDRGVPMAQVFALAQPQLQALWEAQQKWGFAVDDTTQALLTEAEAQGFVGAAMKSVNEQILSVLLAIGKVLGADIPAALANLPGAAASAAAGMNAAFDTVRGPSIDGDFMADDIPAMAAGGIVRRPTLAMIGESGPEAVVPLDSAFNGGSTTVILEADGRPLAEIVVPHIPGVVQRYGLA